MVVITLARSVFVFLYHYSYRYDLQTSSENVCGAFLSSTIVPTTPSACRRVFIIIAPRRTARAPSSFISHVFLLQSIQKRNEKRNFELRFTFKQPFVFHDRSDDAFGTISAYVFIIIARRKNRARAHLLLLYLTYFCCKIQKRNEEIKETLSSDVQKKHIR